MYQTTVNMQYGVKRIDDRTMVRMDCTPPLTFLGVPVATSDLCYRDVHNVKRWKRMNRPAKVRTRDRRIPASFILNPPLTPQPTIICHPDIVDMLMLREAE